MPLARRLCAFALPLLLATAAVAQDPGSCIVAGRLADDGHWAPRFAGVELLAGDGRVIRAGGKSALAAARQVRLAQPALLSRCDGSGPLARADDEPAGVKAPVPALAAGVADVESVAFPKLRTGGELVELRLRVPAERVVMVTR